MACICRYYDVHGMRLSVELEGLPLPPSVAAVLEPFAVPENKGTHFKLRMGRALSAPTGHPIHRLRETWRGVLASGLYVIYRAGEDVQQIELPGLAEMHMDTARREATLNVKPGAEWAIEYGCITPMLRRFLGQVGQYVVHAASLATDDCRAVLLSGISGLGKTTTALALAHSGMHLMADDASFVGRAKDSSLAIWGLPRPCKIHQNTLSLMPWLSALPRRPARTEDEHLIDLPDIVGADGPRTAKPGIILFLEQRNAQGHQLRPIDKVGALARLTRENVRAADRRATGPAGQAFRTITQLVEQSDTYLLSVGPQLDSLYQTVIALLK